MITIDLSKQQWHLWLDRAAEWEHDPLFTPEKVNLASMPVNPPTVGWDRLARQESKAITLPASVEECFGGGINAWEYHGVSWYFTDIDVPDGAEGKRAVLAIEKTRLRAEIYVNEQLVGYDLVSETPYEVDITDVVHYGASNKVAIRITNVGGTRGWNDIVAFKWGKHDMLPSHDFSVVGHVGLKITDKTYIDNVFVKNVLLAKANNLEIRAEIISDRAAKAKLGIEIIDAASNQCIFEGKCDEQLSEGGNLLTHKICVPEAKLWDADNPNLYYCKVAVTTDHHRDEVTERFGFRVIEVKPSANGDNNYYLNGRRFRHRSAIDWGYYSGGGIYATEEMARKSVQAAKDIGHNGINFHRQIGEPLVMDKADELGLYMYEEPAGIKTGDIAKIPATLSGGDTNFFSIEKHPLCQALFEERLKRMIRRDRNHPSLLFYTIANEDMKYTDYRAKVLRLANELDDSRLLSNSSGSNRFAMFVQLVKSFWNKSWTITPSDNNAVKYYSHQHFKPYSNRVETNHVDMHTVNAPAIFNEAAFKSHPAINGRPTRYWGEVSCYCGPSNWYQVYEDESRLAEGRIGYSSNIYAGMHKKISDNFHKWNLEGTCDGQITTMADVSRQAARGLMYADGRLSQIICSYNGADGYAINGWTSGPQVGSLADDSGARATMDWDSALLDEGRNLKGPAEDYAYWSNDLQIAIFRNNGKYFNPGEVAEFKLVLINEGRLEAGRYRLNISLCDEAGNTVPFRQNMEVQVSGGSIFAEDLDEYSITIPGELRGGHITVRAELFSTAEALVAGGSEQVLLDNPSSFAPMLKPLKGEVYHWDSAEKAMNNAGASLLPFGPDQAVDYILAGATPDNDDLAAMLKKVKNGAKLVIKFDPDWAEALFEAYILSERVTEWGCEQEGFWYGNGWGYISKYAGHAIPAGNIVSTNGWQVSGDPQGFYPFESDHHLTVHGLWLARHDIMRVLVGTIQYGKGEIILNPAYEISENDILSQIMLYSMVR